MSSFVRGGRGEYDSEEEEEDDELAAWFESGKWVGGKSVAVAVAVAVAVVVATSVASGCSAASSSGSSGGEREAGELLAEATATAAAAAVRGESAFMVEGGRRLLLDMSREKRDDEEPSVLDCMNSRE